MGTYLSYEEEQTLSRMQFIIIVILLALSPDRDYASTSMFHEQIS